MWITYKAVVFKVTNLAIENKSKFFSVVFIFFRTVSKTVTVICLLHYNKPYGYDIIIFLR